VITHRTSRGLDPAAVTLADVFQQAGYATGMFGKWHLGTRDYFHPLQRGFDEFFGFLAGAHSFFPAKRKEPIYSTVMRGKTPWTEPEYLTDAFARETVNFIKAHKEEPFFVYVPFNAVHTPLEATDEYLKRFPNEGNSRQQTYNAMTSALDDAVGKIVQTLKDTGIDDNTLIIFLNDNGGPIYTQVQSNGRLRLGKLFLFEGGIRVPMIVRWPGALQPGSVYRKPVSSLDVFPTACAAARIGLPSGLSLDGMDLLPYLKGDNANSPHDTLFWSNGPNKAVRLGNWKMIVVGDHKFLFNLSDDIGEKKNLAEQQPQVVHGLEKALKEWQSRMKPPAWPSKPNRRIVDIDGVPYELNI
jgi:arylsulfatase A-like enzyme